MQLPMVVDARRAGLHTGCFRRAVAGRYLPLILTLTMLHTGADAQARTAHGFSPIFSLHGAAASAHDDVTPAGATALTGIYPNPFNPRTMIVFEVAAPEPVELAVFDLRGRMVRVLSSGVQSAGHHEVPWNGTDGTGLPLATGAYVCRLKTSHGSQSLKMTVAR